MQCYSHGLTKSHCNLTSHYSGCGKTSLLKAIAGRIHNHQYEGSIEYNGVSIEVSNIFMRFIGVSLSPSQSRNLFVG